MPSTEKSKFVNMEKLKKFFYFALIGGFGTILNTAILFVLSQKAGMNYLIASAIATEIAIVSNFSGNNFLTFKNQNTSEKIYKKFLSFQLISLISLFGTIFLLWFFVTLFGKDLLLIWNVLAILMMFIVNFALNSKFTWKARAGLKSKDNAVFLGSLFSIGIFFTLLLAQSAHASNAAEDLSLQTSATQLNLNLTDTANTMDTAAKKAGDNSTNISDLTQSSLQIFTVPGLVSISLNSIIIATSDAGGFLVLQNLTPGISLLAASKANFTDFSSQITLLPGSNSINITLNQTNFASNSTNASNSTQNSSNAGDIVAVSQLGYHPSSIKQVVVYTKSLSGIFSIRDAGTNAVIASFPLQKPKNFAGSDVNCQGNMPCLTGEFTNFTTQGTYYAEENGVNSQTFAINQNIFSSTIPLFFEFFNAQLQQGSSYHADFHSGYSPQFTSISDGSFIMEADQAALALIRLGSAYRRNPQLFQFDSYNILASGKPDIQEYTVGYADYLENLQGVSVQEGNSPSAVRLGTGMVINNIFVPGPTSLTSMSVYIPGTPPTLLQTAPVVSLCGANDGSAGWQACISNAASIYKCQINEPCLNMTYNDRMGTVTSDASTNGYAVSKGWGYEFGCYFDVNINSGGFNNGAINPCQVFYNDTNRQYTSMTLLAFLEAWPAVNDFSQSKGQELLARSINTYSYIKNNYPAFVAGDSDSGFYGTAMFLLYDYTNNSAYLQEAYNARSAVSTTFISDMTHGNEFYWEEYVRHKNALISSGNAYAYAGQNPEELFRNKIYNDYKDAGPTSISNNGERIFQFDPNIQFQNSRYMLTEGLLGAKAAELAPNPEPFINVVADNQLSWLTGMNLVQQGVGFNAPVKSMSFIFGIGSFPNQFHSRWLVDTGYSAASAGSVIGARGTGYQFFDSASNSYVYLDGVANILGDQLGALGNGWHNESVVDQFHVGMAFKNGRTYIPGWINGAYPAAADGDTIFNYNDNLHAYEYTESTNEIVATAIEYYAYLDGELNNKPRYVGNAGNFSMPGNQTNSTTNSTTNVTNVSNSSRSNLQILTNPGLVIISLNSLVNATSDAGGFLVLQNLTPGVSLLTASKINFTTFSGQITLLPGNNSINITLTAIPNPESNVSVKIISNSTSLQPIPGNVSIKYSMREDATAIFTVTSNAANNITWFVDGIAQNTTVAQNASFSWHPDVLWVPRAPDFSNNAVSTIKAQSLTESVTWNVNVENVINPFFSGINDGADVVGSIDTKVRILTNNKYLNFTAVNVTLVSGSGSAVYQLSKKFNNSNETEWAIYILPLPSGNNYLTQIIGFNNATGKNTTYYIGFARAHYVTPPASSSGQGSAGDSSVSNNDNGGGAPLPFNPVLVYAIFAKDVVNANESQTLTLDAKNFNAGVYSVEAKLINPQGNVQALTLELVQGTHFYGTWAATFKSALPGKYTLYSVEMGTFGNRVSKAILVTDHTFYIPDQGFNASDKLGLIYTVLSQSQVSNGTAVNLTLDARDSQGILSVSARIEGTGGENFSIPLEIINGKNTYGTWKGSFTVTKPDTTYAVKSVTLKSADGERSFDLTDRLVYVSAVPNPQKIAQSGMALNRITGASVLSIFSAEHLSEAIKKPFVPTVLGFSLMFVAIGGVRLVKKKQAN